MDHNKTLEWTELSTLGVLLGHQFENGVSVYVSTTTKAICPLTLLWCQNESVSLGSSVKSMFTMMRY